jgi:ribosomal protein S4
MIFRPYNYSFYIVTIKKKLIRVKFRNLEKIPLKYTEINRSRKFFDRRFNRDLLFKKRFRAYFGNIRIKNLKKLFIKIKKSNLNKGFSFFQSLEMRLDKFLMRIKFAFSINHAKQLILHNKILVNNILVNKYKYKVKKGDLIEFFFKYRFKAALLIYNRITNKPIDNFLIFIYFFRFKKFLIFFFLFIYFYIFFFFRYFYWYKYLFFFLYLKLLLNFKLSFSSFNIFLNYKKKNNLKSRFIYNTNNISFFFIKKKKIFFKKKYFLNLNFFFFNNFYSSCSLFSTLLSNKLSSFLNFNFLNFNFYNYYWLLNTYLFTPNNFFFSFFSNFYILSFFKLTLINKFINFTNNIHYNSSNYTSFFFFDNFIFFSFFKFKFFLKYKVFTKIIYIKQFRIISSKILSIFKRNYKFLSVFILRTRWIRMFPCIQSNLHHIDLESFRIYINGIYSFSNHNLLLHKLFFIKINNFSFDT